ncbi:MAG: hypothetical protein DRJ68_04975 [Thermoprotei archaeon]|nr:MAG: hypothetical protein DRJ68_04975 [Thermoprotei archaeon]
MPIQLPYDFAVVLVQLYPNITMERLLEILRLTGHLWREPTNEDLELMKLRLKHASTWVEKYAPEGLRLKLLEDPSTVRGLLTDKQREALRRAASIIMEREWNLNELNNKLFDLARSMGLPPSQFFEAAYMALMGRRSGPRLVNFIAAIGREKAAEMFLRASV